MEHTKNVTLRKCGCGNKSCGQYFISSSRADGRFFRPDVLLYAAAPEMLGVLIHEYKMMCTYCNDEVCVYDSNLGVSCGVEIKRVIEKATGKTIDEVIKNGLTK